MARADHLALIAGMSRIDGSSLDEADREAALDIAVVRYSKDRPRALVADLVSPGGVFLPLPAGWVVGMSSMISVETPIDMDPPVISAASVEEVPAGWRLRLAVPMATGEMIRLRWTVPHVVDDTTDTLPVADREAVAAYAAAHLLEAMAAARSADCDSSIGAANVGWQSAASEYAKRAKDLRGRYFVALGLDSDRVVPAGTVVSVTRPDSLGAGRLTHGRRRWGMP
ncbi:hypothetical protein [Insolitispirillum peregrinum]